MKARLLLAAIAAASALPAVLPAAPAAKTAKDWSLTVSATPEGGYLMGNPTARVKLVEYGSLTCPHCAKFSHDAAVPLRAYVRQGRVSWEFRPYLLFPTDPGISLLLRCAGPASFFQTADRIYAEQPIWVRRLQALPKEKQTALQSMAPLTRTKALVRAAGIDRYFRQRGMSEARVSACLSDSRGLDALLAITKRASGQEEVHGTPTFFINGAKADASDWATLEPLIRQAGG